MSLRQGRHIDTFTTVLSHQQQLCSPPSLATMLLRFYHVFLFVMEVFNLVLLIASTVFSPVLRAIQGNKAKSVHNRVVLITGAGSGIGRELATRFARSGAITVLWDVNEVSTSFIDHHPYSLSLCRMDSKKRQP